MTVRVLRGDARTILPTLPANSVHCVVTSPPYYGLRDYGTAQWEGGDAACDHKHPTPCRSGKTTLINSTEYMAQSWGAFRSICGKCGARRIDAQLGLEATPDEYIAEMVAGGAQELRDAGIPGIRYLDQSSRAAGQGTSNYVVFDPDTIDIIRRYGVPAMIAGGATTSAYGLGSITGNDSDSSQ